MNYADETHPASVSDFRLDVYEVTVGRFRDFVAGYPENLPAPTAGRDPENLADPGWDPGWNDRMEPTQYLLLQALACDGAFATWTDAPAGNEAKPMNCVTWYEAYAFCVWDGGRLPTEAEWNYAAAGGAEQRIYPWSSPPSSSPLDDAYAVYCGGSCNFIPNVGSKPAGTGKWGHADLGGSVSEWNVDAAGAYPVPCDDCAQFAPPGNHAVRGGSFRDGQLDVAFRDGAGTSNRLATLGFRCARTP